MRGLTSLLPAVLLFSAGCASKLPGGPAPSSMPSMIATADPAAAPQLLRGFHGVEANAWRWTAREFAVQLGLPRTAAAKGALLVLRFGIPDNVIERLHSIQLSATVNGTALPPQTYSKPGDMLYERAVSAAALIRDPALVTFTLDQALPPTATDNRELGIVVRAVGFELN